MGVITENDVATFNWMDSFMNLIPKETIDQIGEINITLTRKEDMSIEIRVEYEDHSKTVRIANDDIDETTDQRFIDYVSNPYSDWDSLKEKYKKERS